MLVASFAAPMFATNCWVIATEPGAECVVIDPGMPDVSHQLDGLLQELRLKPVAVIATHGHLDHTFSIRAIADGYEIPSYIHSQDRAALSHPERVLSPEFAATLSGMEFIEPKDVRELRNGELLEIVGVSFRAIHAPGHTAGSLMFEVSNELLISGDVLFAGSIGRTDQPTGSAKDMEETLRKKVLPLDDHLRVLPGHGPETTISRERRNNPYLNSLKGRY
ncbi:MAG: MBL fold metallo-hydrolase [Actinobacteria bacterium]|nr:MBL fold metallo-hydrolase [Actinomycetota bacterium]MSW62446.1 MBL fold metallo-hydrolase [Actinomycetota bacterium]MSX89553.1 MBL fold metallo-hydrolase [Actinomycetota bacterium]MSZ63751.1 MBL fold metallo-hydrolase [Actinomycetota bacterium]MTA57840.1 MBL fold metallo-hydrolase [Actinomycetota bacterium]